MADNALNQPSTLSDHHEHGVLRLHAAHLRRLMERQTVLALACSR